MAWNPHDGWREDWRASGYGGDWQDEPYEEPRRPQRRVPWLGLFISSLIAIMFIWQALQTPFTADDRFGLIVEDTVAYAYGGTDSDSYADVLGQLDANPQIETIVLRHVPGTTDMRVNNRIAQLIRERGIDTHLERGSYIASGGVDLWLSGEQRTMECGARVGVHSWATSEGDTPATLGHDPMQPRMEAFHERLGVDEDFYEFARDAAPHSTLYFLNQADVQRFDLLNGASCERTGIFKWLG